MPDQPVVPAVPDPNAPAAPIIAVADNSQTRWDKFLNNAVNKFHILLGGACQGCVMLYHFKTGKDLGPVVSTTVFAFYGFLLGHAGVYQKWPDQQQ